MNPATTFHHGIIVRVKPTPNRNCTRVVARVSEFKLERGICFDIELMNPLDLVLDRKILWIEGDLFKNWPAGGPESDLAYFKPLILDKVNQDEDESLK